MIFSDIVEGWPDCWEGLLDAPCDHPYDCCISLRTNRPGSLLSDMDLGIVIKRRTGVPYTFITEGGISSDDSEFSKGDLISAYKNAEHWLIESYSGMFQGNMQLHGYGIGNGWGQANTAFSAFAYMTEDRPVMADIWPYSELLHGAIYANKNWITDEVKALGNDMMEFVDRIIEKLKVEWSAQVSDP